LKGRHLYGRPRAALSLATPLDLNISVAGNRPLKRMPRKRTRSLSSIDKIKKSFEIYQWWIEQVKSPFSSPMLKNKKRNNDLEENG